ncbi:mucin-1-like [Frankliniella occidentalis]|uniref:Mucin-1-like n=1 Tax=Frankliniella occidentalis TaxID=133901 RepID=A0A9C6X023_FRAOC|nr:mucin-1-like [Frankliniella occidentalis]
MRSPRAAAPRLASPASTCTASTSCSSSTPTFRRVPLGALTREASISITDFPDTFQDFFARLSEDAADEDADCGLAVMENKLIPQPCASPAPSPAPSPVPSPAPLPRQRSTTTASAPTSAQAAAATRRTQVLARRSFHRRQAAAAAAAALIPLAATASPGRHKHQGAARADSDCSLLLQSPAVANAATRRRSSSIAVPRPPPDVHRFLQTEQQWARKSPSHSLGVSPGASPGASPGHSASGGGSAAALPQTPGRGARASVGSATPSETTSSYRNRTASMPAAVPRHRPMLAQTRRSAGPGGAAEGETSTHSGPAEYYRLRSFSITPSGIFNLGDSFRSRRSRSNGSVASTTSSNSDDPREGRERLPSGASVASVDGVGPAGSAAGAQDAPRVPCFKVAMLGASGVGKTTLTYQFTTSEYICAYDTSLDEEFGQKTVSVLLDGQESDLEIVDHPAAEMSAEAFCATYNPDVFVVVYSVVERRTFQTAEDILLFLWKSEYMTTRGVVLVGNKADLERKREVSTSGK